MRYSIIHHDVRKAFDLTISAYFVCDSIHQLSHGAPTKKTNKEIGEFIGIDNSHVGHVKKILIEKGLITDDESGCQTTETWMNAVTFASGKIPTKVGKSQPKWENPTPYTYSKEDKESNGDVDVKQKRTKKYPHSDEVFALWGTYPRAWATHTTQLVAAENLYTERGIEEIKDALAWYEQNKEKPYCPVVTSPHDLDGKWAKLEAFNDKHHD